MVSHSEWTGGGKSGSFISRWGTTPKIGLREILLKSSIGWDLERMEQELDWLQKNSKGCALKKRVSSKPATQGTQVDPNQLITTTNRMKTGRDEMSIKNPATKDVPLTT